MKKIFLLAICLTLAGLLAVNGTFAFPDLDGIFANLTEWLNELGVPIANNTEFDVSLVYPDGSQTPMLTPGVAVSRRIAVFNAENSRTAYFRIAIAMQKDVWPLANTLSVTGEENAYQLTDWREVTIDNKPYQLMFATYTRELSADTISPSITLSIQLDSSATSAQLNKLDQNFLRIQVLAIEAEAFTPTDGYDSAEDALDAALPLTNLNPF